MRYLVTGQRSLSYDQTSAPKLTKDFALKHIEERGKELMRFAGNFLDDANNTTDKAVSRTKETPNK